MEEHHMKAFRRDYYILGKYHLQSQVPHLARLADDYSQRYSRTGHWTDCLKSHALYNSCGARRPNQDGWTERTYMLQKQFLGANFTTSYEDHKNLVITLRTDLDKIRKEFNEKIEEPKSLAAQIPHDCNNISSYPIRDFTDKMTTVSQNCTNRMMSFAGNIMSNSVESLDAEPPCPFSVVVIGSMAKGEATPYSDLEYMLLIKTKSHTTLNYFHNLAMASYFLIGNLRETKLSYMDVEELHGWFDDCATNGFKIDGLSLGAGNIPTGRGTPETENKFILTPEELLLKYQEVFQNPDGDESKRGDFTAMVSYMSSVYVHGEGAENLLPQVKSHMECLVQTETREMANLEMLRNDISKFSFKPSANVMSKGYTVNVKREIFRFPSIFILGLAILHRKCSSSTWETLSVLENSKVITSTTKEKLEFLLASACFIRLAAYLFYGTHDDRMSVALREGDKHKSSPNACQPKSQQRWFVPFHLYYMMCRTTVPLKEQLQKCQNLKTFVDENVHNNDKWINELKILIYSERVSDAMHVLTERFGDDIKTNATKCLEHVNADPQLLAGIGFALKSSSNYNSAAQIYQRLFDTGLMNGEELSYAWALYHLNQPEGALQVLKTLADKSARDYGFIGDMYRMQGMFEEADECLVTSLNIYCKEASQEQLHDYHGQPIKIEDEKKYDIDLLSMDAMERLKWIPYCDRNIINALYLLGQNYTMKGMHSEAISYCLKSLDMAYDFYGRETVTSEIISACNTLSIAYNRNKEPEKALKYSQRCLHMYRQIYEEPQMNIAGALNNTGYYCLGLKRYSEAFIYFQQCIGMLKELNLQNSLCMAHSLDSLGEYYAKTFQFNKSQHIYQEAQAAFRTHHPNHAHITKIDLVLSKLQERQACLLQLPLKCRYPIC